jgi:hypothetical protein
MLNYDQKARIARDVILGVPPPAAEDQEAAAWRQQVAVDKAAADKAGLMLDLPFEWEHHDVAAAVPTK